MTDSYVYELENEALNKTPPSCAVTLVFSVSVGGPAVKPLSHHRPQCSTLSLLSSVQVSFYSSMPSFLPWHPSSSSLLLLN